MIFFVTGVNGAGKSSVIPHLLSSLDSEKYAIHDFDERGVPNNANRTWRLNETKYWLELGFTNSTKGIRTIICGFARPTEILQLPYAEFTSCILLDLDETTLHTRIQRRYKNEIAIKELLRATGKSVEKFTEDNVKFLKVLKEECEAHKSFIIDTKELTAEQVAVQVISLLNIEFEKADE